MSGRWKRIAIPWGFAFVSVSGIEGRPVDEEKRTVIGVLGERKWGADVSKDPAGEGVKVPVRRRPFACARRRCVSYWAGLSKECVMPGLKPGCGPAAAWRVVTRPWLVSRTLLSVESGILECSKTVLLKIRFRQYDGCLGSRMFEGLDVHVKE